VLPSLPTFMLSLAIASLYATFFHLLWGRSLRELIVYWSAAVLGFMLGQSLASALNWGDALIGELHPLAASLFSWSSMVLARQLKL
jgi:hypothetical protein